MADYGPNVPDAASTTGTGVEWDGEALVYADDGNYAQGYPFRDLPAFPADHTEAYQTNVALWTDFGFSIPTDYSITNVTVTVKRSKTAAALRYPGTGIKDMTLKLVVGGALVGANKAATEQWPDSLEIKTYSYDMGGTGWDYPLTPSEANASDFGFGLQIQGTGGPAPIPRDNLPPYDPPTGNVEIVKMTITALPNTLRVDSVSSKWCYTVTSAIPGQTGGVKWDFLAFSPLRKLWGIRNSGHIDEIEWNSDAQAAIEGLGRDGSYPMPDGFWESQKIRGGRVRLTHVGIDKSDPDDAVEITATCDKGEASRTATGRWVRFPITQQGNAHQVKITITEDIDGVESIECRAASLSEGLRE